MDGIGSELEDEAVEPEKEKERIRSGNPFETHYPNPRIDLGKECIIDTAVDNQKCDGSTSLHLAVDDIHEHCLGTTYTEGVDDVEHIEVRFICHILGPKIAVPTRTSVAPSSTAIG